MCSWNNNTQGGFNWKNNWEKKETATAWPAQTSSTYDVQYSIPGRECEFLTAGNINSTHAKTYSLLYESGIMLFSARILSSLSENQLLFLSQYVIIQ